MANKSDSLIIGYDSCDTDRTSMIVGRIKGDTIFIINEFFDDEAEEIYKKLTTLNFDKKGDNEKKRDNKW